MSKPDIVSASPETMPTILVIDDTMANLSVITSYLIEHNINILVAQDGQSGLEKALLAIPDLILLDVTLPDMDGFEVCRRLKALEQTSSIPVIFITAHALQTDDKVRGFAVGGVDYVEKPIQQQELLARINTHLRIQSLTQSLQRRTVELQHYQTQLEAMVAQRTDELAQTVVRLEEEIAERKQTEEVLRRSEERYRTLAQNLPDSALLLYDYDLRFILTDGPELEATGFSREMLEGKTLHEALPPDFTQMVEPNMRRALAGEVFHAELPFEDRIYHYSYVPLRDGSGTVAMAMILANNITERKRSEEKLRQAQLVLESSPAILFRWKAHPDWQVELVSENISRFGYTPEELLSGVVQYTSIIHPDDLERATREVIDYSSRGVDHFQREYRILTRDGQVRWADDRTVIERDAMGAITHYQGIVVDITERKHAEMRLKHSETSLNEAQQLAHLGSWEWNILTGENIWSAEQYRIFGYMPGAIEPNYVLLENALHPADKDRVLAAMHNTVQTGVPYEDEYRIIRPDQAERILHAKTTMQCDGEGTSCRVIGVVWDITEHKKLEELLAQRAAQLEKVAHISSAISAVLDVNTLLPKVVNLVKEQFGYSHSQIYLRDISSDTLTLAAEADKECHQMLANGHHIQIDDPHSIVARVAREKQGLIINDIKPTSSVSPNPLLPKTRSRLAVPLIVGDEVIGVFDVQSNEADHFTAEDTYIQTTLAGQVAVSIENARQFAARKQTEDRLVTYTAKLEASNRDLQEFAYVAAHDLQEPLRKVLAFGDRLAIKYNDALDETGVDYLRRMQDASRRMQTLINDLLSFSRVSTRAQPFQDVDLAEITRDVLSDLESRIEQKKASVTIEEMARIQVDPTQIRQLLQNLVGNALKFSHVERPLQIKISAKITGGTCQIRVEDNGIGFDTKYLDRIFKPFQRLHDRSEYEGSGMGLAICRRIVERHSGSITAISEIDKGATFIVTLPVRQVEGNKP